MARTRSFLGICKVSLSGVVRVQLGNHFEASQCSPGTNGSARDLTNALKGKVTWKVKRVDGWCLSWMEILRVVKVERSFSVPQAQLQGCEEMQAHQVCKRGGNRVSFEVAGAMESLTKKT